MARLFISYSHKNSDFVQRLAQSLLEAGADPFVDQEGIRPGQDWGKAIQSGLDTAELMLLILSPDALESRHVDAEWGYFYDQEKPILPILHQAIPKFPFQLNRLQYIDFVNSDFDTAFGRLREALYDRGVSLTPSPVQAEPPPAPPAPVEEPSPPALSPPVVEPSLPAIVEVAAAEVSPPPIAESPKPVAKPKSSGKSAQVPAAESPKPPARKKPGAKQTPSPAAEAVKPAAQKSSGQKSKQPSTPPAAEPPPSSREQGFVADVQTNIYTELMNKPGGAATKEGNVSWNLPAGTKLQTLQHSQDKKWAQVKTRSGRIGWVMATDLSPYSASGAPIERFRSSTPPRPAAKSSGGLAGITPGGSGVAPAKPFTPNAKVLSPMDVTVLRKSPTITTLTMPVSTVKDGEEVQIIGQTASGGWYEIETRDGGKGWIISSSLRTLTGKFMPKTLPDIPITDKPRVRKPSASKPSTAKSAPAPTHSDDDLLRDALLVLGCVAAIIIAVIAGIIYLIISII